MHSNIRIFCFVQDRALTYNPGWHQVLDPPASASQMLRLQAYTTMPGFKHSNINTKYLHNTYCVLCTLHILTQSLQTYTGIYPRQFLLEEAK
jgi:hypothetical protein